MGRKKVILNAHVSTLVDVSDAENEDDKTQWPTTLNEPESTSTLISSLSAKATPQPLPVCSLAVVAAPSDDDNDTFYDAIGPPDFQTSSTESRPTGESQQKPAHVSAAATVVDNGEIFYDADDTQEANTNQTHMIPHDMKAGSTDKQITNNRLGRGCTSGVCSSPVTSTVIHKTIAPSVPAPQKRGSSSSVASPPTVDPACVPGADASHCKGLFTGINYPKFKKPLNLKYAAHDAIGLGQTMADKLGLRGENVVFAVDAERPNSAKQQGCSNRVCVGSGRNRTIGVGRNQLSPNEPKWHDPIYFDNEKRFIHPTRKNVLEGFRWLVSGAKEGDHLVWLFSGHCMYIDNKPYLVTANIKSPDACVPTEMISKEDIRDELVLKVPKGCRLEVFLDCCYSSAMIDLQYCIDRMLPKERSRENQVPVVRTQPLERHVTLKLGQVQAPTCISADDERALIPEQGRRNIHVSLHGLQSVAPSMGDLEPTGKGLEASIDPIASARELVPASHPQDSRLADPLKNTVSPSSRKPSKRSDSVAAAPPLLPAPPPVRTPASWISNWIKTPSIPVSEGLGEHTGARPLTAAQVRHGRQGAVAASGPPEYLGERKRNFDRPEGYVTVWAAAGARQQAFEASEPAEHGILANVLCEALDDHHDITTRELWYRLCGAVELENEKRSQRDGNKSEGKRPAIERAQHAELWASHPEALHSTGPILARRVFPAMIIPRSQSTT